MGRPPVNILSRQLIAENALTMYQELGFRGSSLRKLADRLGVKSPSLYHHIASQDDLIDAMREVIQQTISDVHLHDPDWRRGIGERSLQRGFNASRSLSPSPQPPAVDSLPR